MILVMIVIRDGFGFSYMIVVFFGVVSNWLWEVFFWVNLVVSVCFYELI